METSIERDEDYIPKLLHTVSKFKGKYRSDSTRLAGWDYSSPGFYFVTICTKNHKPILGIINDGKMLLSPAGVILAEEWRKSDEIRTLVSMDEFIIMPNHIHGIIIINDISSLPIDEASTRAETNYGTAPRSKSISLGNIIRQFKSVCTRRIRSAGFDKFAWQSRFYDHIIRDDESLQRIREYIQSNPQNWESDQYHSTK
jgi:REP element-mobilizing transposase RayT